MSLSNYIHACRRLSEELAGSMAAEDIDRLRSELQGTPIEDWRNWRARNDAHIARFVAATSSERKRRKDWREPVLRLQLTLAAIQHLRQAETVLRAVEEEYLQPGLSYRQMAAMAGTAYWRILQQEIPDWPFDGPSPFS